MTQYIDLIDKDVDGCGTDIHSILVIKNCTDVITNGFIERIGDAIAKRKMELSGEWTTDDCLDAAIEEMEKDGLEVEYISDQICEIYF